jgi:hypothetical protein
MSETSAPKVVFRGQTDEVTRAQVQAVRRIFKIPLQFLNILLGC